MEPLRERYVETTRRTLLDTALRLFTERDYNDVSAEELVRAAGLTRGALYHHFDGKRGLFEAVFNDLEHRAATRIRAAVDRVADPLERIDSGVVEFFEVCAEDDYRRIVMLHGPIALGWERWRELDQQHLGAIVLEGIQSLFEQHQVDSHRAEIVSAALFGALAELSFTVAEADDPEQTRSAAAALVHDLLEGLVGSGGRARRR